MRIIRSRKQAKIGRRSPKKRISKWDWFKVKDMIIGLGKPKNFSKSSWECKEQERMRWAKEAQRNRMGRESPR